jgi:peptidoglycan hydrolase CwlO-like protein
MDLIQQKTKLESELESINKQITELSWKAKIVASQLKKFNSLINKANEIIKDEPKA